MKKKYLDSYEIDDDRDRIDFDILEEWLSNTYWSPRIKKDEILKGTMNSTVVVGCYLNLDQVGYLRVVSDKTRFGYIMDVYVAESHRKKGIALNMVRFALEHPELKDVGLWLLGTRDAHRVYQKIGFGALSHPERWMMLKKQDWE